MKIVITVVVVVLSLVVAPVAAETLGEHADRLAAELLDLQLLASKEQQVGALGDLTFVENALQEKDSSATSPFFQNRKI